MKTEMNSPNDAPPVTISPTTTQLSTMEPIATSQTAESAELLPSTLASRRSQRTDEKPELTIEPYKPERNREYNGNPKPGTKARRTNTRPFRRPSILENQSEPSGQTPKQQIKFFAISANDGRHLSGIDVIRANREIQKL